ncbi:MAG: hypothetical protein AAF985_01685 [Bacteroidota bacterium]
MSKTPSNKLFNLIKSLSGTEKRYFKVYVNNRHGERESKYLQLFEAIDLQATFDEEALKKAVYGTQPVQTRKYSELKSYLYDLILKVLQGYDEKTSIDFRLKNKLQSVRVLYKRSHYLECIELLEKAKKLAYKYEFFLHVVEILDWEKRVAYAQENIEFLDSELKRINGEEKYCLEQIRNLSTYRNILYQLIISRRKDAVLRSEKKVENLNRIMSHPMLESIERATSHRARILFYRIYSNYSYSILAYEDFYHYSRQMVLAMEAQTHLLQEETSAYIFGMTNLMLSCGLLQKHEELRELLDAFRQIKANSLDDEFRIFKHYNNFNFRLCITTGDFESGLKALKSHLKEAKKFERQSFERGSFYFQYCYIYFGMGDFGQALECLNQWLSLPKSVEREDLQSLARILNLIIHYEMENTELLEYLVRSTYRFLKKRNRVFEFEKRVLAFIQQSIKIHEQKTLKKAFQNLREDIERLAGVPSERIMLQYFDFISWIDSKIENQSFGALVKKRYQENRQDR